MSGTRDEDKCASCGDSRRLHGDGGCRAVTKWAWAPNGGGGYSVSHPLAMCGCLRFKLAAEQQR